MYCGHSGVTEVVSIEGIKKVENHDPYCPKNWKLKIHPVLPDEDLLFPKSERQRSLELWDKGASHGRRAVKPTTENETYMLGWLSGDCAREEAENGHDPVWHVEY